MDRDTAYSVSDLAERLRGAVESALGQVWVKGEVSGLRSYQSGHWYFTLRDPVSQLRCVMWRTYTQRVSAQPPEGTEVFVLATPTVWADKGELRLSVVVLLPTAGLGLQHLGREKTRAALLADGLLDPARKRALPPFPRAIAVVTSVEGAALRDIVSVARKRWPSLRLLVVPSKVQGEEARRELVRALRLVNRLDGVDLCIVGRGGGAKEDLHAFDDEQVCRALAAVRVPTVSAVGHEADVPLADLVADARAPTPSAAVELAVPDRDEAGRRVDTLAARLAQGLRRRTGLVTARLARAGDRLQAAMARRLDRPRDLVGRLSAQLEALSPLRVLGRGYSVARLPDGRVVRRQAELPVGAPFRLQVSDGPVAARSEGIP